MDITKNRIIDELLGDNKSEYIAYDLKKTYKDLKETLYETENEDNSLAPIWSYNKKKEIKKIKKMMKAIKKAYSWYSSDDIEKE